MPSTMLSKMTIAEFYAYGQVLCQLPSFMPIYVAFYSAFVTRKQHKHTTTTNDYDKHTYTTTITTN